MTSPLVTFTLAGIRYAFEVREVVEVTGAVPVAPVPRTADRVVGVTAWRGKTIPVLDPRPRLKREARKPDVMSRILVVGRPSPFGVLIDDPGRVLRATDVHAVETHGPASGDPGVRLVRTPEGVVRVLDPEAVLGDVRTLVREKA